MPDEEETQTEETTENTGDQKDADSQDEGGEQVDWEKRYKDLQAEHTQTAQKTAQLEQQVQELVRTQRGGGEAEEEELDLGDGDFVDKKTVDKMVNSAVTKALSIRDKQSADRYFRKTYPDLVDNEGAIAGLVSNLSDAEKAKCSSYEDFIDTAVDKFKGMIDKAKAEGKSEADAEKAAQDEAKQKASGLSSSSTSSAKSGDEDVSDEQEIAHRKKKQQQRMSVG